MNFKLQDIKNFQKVFEKSKTKIRGFEGCLKLELVQDIHNPAIFFTISQWKDQNASFLGRMELKPNELVMNSISNRIRENEVIEVILEDQCIKKYQAQKNGFLFIE